MCVVWLFNLQLVWWGWTTCEEKKMGLTEPKKKPSWENSSETQMKEERLVLALHFGGFINRACRFMMWIYVS